MVHATLGVRFPGLARRRTDSTVAWTIEMILTSRS
jgi:hypothetical protein